MCSFPLGFESIGEPFNFSIVDGSIDFDAMGLGVDVFEIIPKVLLADRAVAVFLARTREHLQ